jgi:uncharacterized protein YuzE
MGASATGLISTKHKNISAMKIHYDRETDSLYIRLSNNKNVESQELAPGLVFDFDENNRVVAIEIDQANTTVDLDQLETDFLVHK